MPGHKERYIQICNDAAPGAWPLQLQPWWLDAVCGSAWDVALVFDGSGKLQGAWPYRRSLRLGLPMILTPPLSAYAGPWLVYPDRAKRPSDRNAFEQKVLEKLAVQLPRCLFFRHSLRPEIGNWLPLYWAGFRQTTRYTYFFESTTDREALWAGLKNTVRTDLRKAERALQISREDKASDIAYGLYRLARRHKGARPSFSPELFERLHTALQLRGQSACFMTRNLADGKPCGSLYLAFDAKEASVIFTGRDPAPRGACAVPALLWAALQFAGERGLRFDFEGSMERGTERLFRAFGGQRLPYHEVSRYW